MPMQDNTKKEDIVVPAKAKKPENRVLLEIHPASTVDVFGDTRVLHERGEQKWYTPAEATELLNVVYGGRVVFQRVSV